MIRPDYIQFKELYHYGIPRRSGRYPWGSGDRPFQSASPALSVYNTATIKEKTITPENKEIKFCCFRDLDIPLETFDEELIVERHTPENFELIINPYFTFYGETLINTIVDYVPKKEEVKIEDKLKEEENKEENKEEVKEGEGEKPKEEIKEEEKKQEDVNNNEPKKEEPPKEEAKKPEEVKKEDPNKKQEEIKKDDKKPDDKDINLAEIL